MPIAHVTFKDGLVNKVMFHKDNRRMFNVPFIKTGRPDSLENYTAKLDRIDGKTGDFYFTEVSQDHVGEEDKILKGVPK